MLRPQSRPYLLDTGAPCVLASHSPSAPRQRGPNLKRVLAKLASKNENKLRELRAALPDWELELLDADDYPPEHGSTYYENARAKASFGRTIAPADVAVLGEDSGIEVETLGGRPGVESARWAEDGVAALLAALGRVDDRRARYVCELVCIDGEGNEFRGTGTVEGAIASEPRGREGFGYDPIFVPLGEDRTVAELGNTWKAENSHRARAAEALRSAVVTADT
jgi:XTP/dITP diphosphohydrolase